MAAVRGHHQTCEYLIRNGVSSTLLDADQRTAAMLAAAHGFAEIVRVIISTDNATDQVTRRDVNGLTLLHHAAVLAINNASYIPSLKKILHALNESHVHVDVAVDDHNRTALMYAAINNNLAVAEALLKDGGADPRLSDSFGVSVLDMARLDELRALIREHIVVVTLRDHESWLSGAKRRRKGSADKTTSSARRKKTLAEL